MSRSRSAEEALAHEKDVRPIVAVKPSTGSVWVFGVLATIAAVLMFVALDARRRARSEVAEAPRAIVVPESVPELVVPAPRAPTEVVQVSPWATPEGAGRAPVIVAGSPQPTIYAPPRQPRMTSATPPSSPPIYAPSPMVVSQPVPTAVPNYAEPTAVGSREGPNARAGGRIGAARLDNPSTTVPQGTLMSAVLETGLDSTGAGQARAMVTKDVYGFDGTRLLVPRGSKLYGTYEAGVDQGQRRAQVRWTRLLRPDGVTISLDSGAADPLGRAGIKGKVNSHFGARLGNALLSSTFGLGNALLSRKVSPVVVVPSGSGQAPPLQSQGSEIKPTLTVRPGARVSVFVEHDLDFSAVEGG